MKRGLIIICLGFLFGIFLISVVFAQADVCVKESASLSTSSQKIYLNEPLSVAKSVLRESDLPTLLKRGTLSGDVDVEYVQNIEMGSYPRIIFAKQPKSSDDPSFVLRLSTVLSNYLYNMSVTFSRSVDFTKLHGKDIELFGKKFSISPLTNNEKIVLVGKDGTRISLANNGVVSRGDNEESIDGTYVRIINRPSATTKIIISIFAPNSDVDAILSGNKFTDLVFGTFKVDFAGLSIRENDESLREIINVSSKGDNSMRLKMKDLRGIEKEFQWAIYSLSGDVELEWNEDRKKIHIMEKEKLFKDDYVIVGNENNGRLLRVSQIINSTTAGTSGDKVQFVDVFSGDTIDATITLDGVGTVSIGGKVYGVRYQGQSSDPSNWATLDYPDSQGAGSAILYPTIESSKGAKVGLYKNKTLNLKNWDGESNKLSVLRLPNGTGYTNINFIEKGNALWNVASGLNSKDIDTRNMNSFVSVKVGEFSYRLRGGGFSDWMTLSIENPKTGGEINSAALTIFEEKDNKGIYNGMIVTLEPGRTSDDGIGVDEVIRTWSKDGEWEALALASDKTKEADIFGTIITIDARDSDQKIALIGYPDEQVYGNIYVNSDICAVPDEEPPEEEKECLRGDVNGDGEIDLSDALYLLMYLFKDGPAPVPCP